MWKISAFWVLPFVFIFVLNSQTGYTQQNNSISLYLEASKFESSGEYLKAADVIEQLLKEEKSAHLYTKLAELLMNASQNDRALSVLHNAEKDFPKDPYFKFLLGRLYEFYKQDKVSALKYYLEAAEFSNDVKYLLSAARSAENNQDFKTAVDMLTKAIDKNPNVSDLYAERGRVYQKSGNVDKSIVDFKKAVEMDSNMSAMLRLADIYLSKNDNASAKDILKKISEQNGDLIIPELKLGDIYRSERDYVKAIELYSQVADKLEGKDKAMILKQMAVLQYDIGDIDNSSRSLKKVTELVPEDTAAGFFAGYLYETQKKYNEAKVIYENMLKYNPKYAQALKRLAAIYVLDGLAEDALKVLAEIDPVEYDIDYYLLMSECYNIKKNHLKSASVLEDALKENPTEVTVLYALALQYDLAGKREKGIDIVKQALKIEPEDPILLNFLGYVYADMGINLDESYKLISKALDKDPKNPAYLDSLGWFYFKKKNYKLAYEYVEKAYKILPNDPEVQEHMKEIKKFIK